jgi:hypothetical protein
LTLVILGVNVSDTKESKTAKKGVFIALGIICLVLVAGLAIMVVTYNEVISSLNSQLANLQKQVNELQNTTDFDRFFLEFGNVSLITSSINFSPPVDMYRALTIALESDGWNASSLSGLQVYVNFLKYSSNDSSGTYLQPVTEPPKDYSAVQINGTTYRYVWDIEVQPGGNRLFIPPLGLYWVDAASGEIVPHGLLM